MNIRGNKAIYYITIILINTIYSITLIGNKDGAKKKYRCLFDRRGKETFDRSEFQNGL